MLKNMLRLLTPPIIWQAAASLLRPARPIPPRFDGPFRSWSEAEAYSDGWDSAEITTMTRAAALKVRDGLAPMEQDGIVRPKVIYSETILAFLLLSISRFGEALSIIDFGGGLGANYYQNRALLAACGLSSIRWNVVEREELVKIGRQEFEGEELHFYASIREIFRRAKSTPHSIVFTGSLQYLSSPYAVLTEAIERGLNLIALDRVLVWPDEHDVIFVQRSDPNAIYSSTYPAWRFSRSKLTNHLGGEGFHLVEYFCGQRIAECECSGMLFTR